VSDTGLEHLEELKALTSLKLLKTNVTVAGVKKLAGVLPNCRIEWDGGVIEPSVASDEPQSVPQALPARYTNSLGMEFALVPKGKAWLGGGEGKLGDREVEFKEDFYLGVYEVTQEEWKTVMGANPSGYARNGGYKDKVENVSDSDLMRFPVDGISWNDAQLYLEALNDRDQQDGWVYRLPLEVEWEYACRGGPASIQLDHAFDFYLENPTNQLLREQANVRHESALVRPCPVGSYPANRLGLHDMHGNVWEWCHDALTNEKGEPQRPYRGGSFWAPSIDARAARRLLLSPLGHLSTIGLRVARVQIDSAPVASTDGNSGAQSRPDAETPPE
jgi:formylglycine-generating enzyme required for sulfatase activity